MINWNIFLEDNEDLLQLDILILITLLYYIY